MERKFKELLNLIKKYDKIIIARHKNPDFDAIGSQVGLYYVLKENFPKKQILLTGDESRFDYENLMKNLSPEEYKDALLIITDVSVKSLLVDDNYKHAKEIAIIDHHTNDCDIENTSLVICDSNYEAAALLTYVIVDNLKLNIPPKAADYFLSGIITDTGRFQYIKDAKRLFHNASKLVNLGADPSKLYLWLYKEPLKDRKLKNEISSKIVYENNVAYFILDKEEMLTKYKDENFFNISRGTVNLMAGIEEIKIWANFVYSSETNDYKCEFRSREIEIVEIAKKYGGGGHALACGASIKDKTLIKDILNDFHNLIKENK